MRLVCFLIKENIMYGYLYPFYRSPYYGNYGGYGYPYNYGGSYYNNNVIGSAIANQNMNTIGAGAIGGIQIATPTVVW
jgi:hypothetical protein